MSTKKVACPAPANKRTFVAIVTDDGVFLGQDMQRWSGNQFPSNYRFDGEFPTPTFKSGWVKVPKLPTKVELHKMATERQIGYILMDKFMPLVSEAIPATLPMDAFDYDDDTERLVSKDGYIPDMYRSNYESVPEEFIDITDTVEIVEVYKHKGKFEIRPSKFKLQYNLLDELNTPEILLPTKPCSLSPLETYRIIREHVKTNINPKVAFVSSDYDFCFTVKKKIGVIDPIKMTTLGEMGKKKPKYFYRSHREETVFQMAPKEYQNYTVIKWGFQGKNQEDLETKMQAWLDGLMEVINEPITECECCKGRGVMFSQALVNGEVE